MQRSGLPVLSRIGRLCPLIFGGEFVLLSLRNHPSCFMPAPFVRQRMSSGGNERKKKNKK
jgi:hypothetical protein